tara:strand:+ start:879 stop:1040 length:162 start_codon:yes stop_codon:yes gene_type:complete
VAAKMRNLLGQRYFLSQNASDDKYLFLQIAFDPGTFGYPKFRGLCSGTRQYRS